MDGRSPDPHMDCSEQEEAAEKLAEKLDRVLHPEEGGSGEA